MSYYTRLELTWDDRGRSAGELSADQVLEAARPLVVAKDWGVDYFLADLRESALGGGLDRQAFNRIEALELIEVLQGVSYAFPDVHFYVRGIGEEHFDSWARHFLAGEVRWGFGPFDPDV
ncbi:MAG: hypothetical protein U1E77_06810 [Inhella sp.]